MIGSVCLVSMVGTPRRRRQLRGRSAHRPVWQIGAPSIVASDLDHRRPPAASAESVPGCRRTSNLSATSTSVVGSPKYGTSSSLALANRTSAGCVGLRRPPPAWRACGVWAGARRPAGRRRVSSRGRLGGCRGGPRPAPPRRPELIDLAPRTGSSWQPPEDVRDSLLTGTVSPRLLCELATHGTLRMLPGIAFPSAWAVTEQQGSGALRKLANL